jgi:hypothetical protein
LKQADITTANVSEILRIYLQANGLGDVKMPAAGEYSRNGSFPHDGMAQTEAFPLSNPTQKAASLGFMVNELLQNKAVIGQIDGAIEGQNTARRYTLFFSGILYQQIGWDINL